jgi:hypothetical protein
MSKRSDNLRAPTYDRRLSTGSVWPAAGEGESWDNTRKDQSEEGKWARKKGLMVNLPPWLFHVYKSINSEYQKSFHQLQER